jgi:CRISPR-associated protein Csb2
VITLKLHFPWKRYHATPWGRFTNEGAVELPPSPWRLLRALYATWKERCPGLAEPVVHDLLTQLAATTPTYLVPPYEIAHTRHYYPDLDHRSGRNGDTDLTVDAFAVLGADASLYVRWPGSPEPELTKALGDLAEALPYLGRADSIVEARLLTEADPLPTGRHTTVSPLLDGDAPPPGWTTIQLLTPAHPLDLAALTTRPQALRAANLIYPPGSRLVTYAVPEPGGPASRAPTCTSEPSRVASPRMQTAPVRPRHTPVPGEPVTAVRLAVNSPALPPLGHIVPLADALRSRCIKPLTATHRGAPLRTSNLVGKHHDGTPLADHRHAHFLPLDTDQDRRIHEIIVWAPGGLDTEEINAIHNAVTGGTIGVPARAPGPRSLHLRITGYGSAADVMPRSWLGPAREFTSATPFVSGRHPKKRQTLDEFFEDEALRELHHRGLPAPASVQPIPGDWTSYVQHRWTKQQTRATDTRPARGLHLTFPQPVTGPLALGHHSHFGLGLLLPVSGESGSGPGVGTRHAGRTEGE